MWGLYDQIKELTKENEKLKQKIELLEQENAAVGRDATLLSQELVAARNRLKLANHRAQAMSDLAT